MHVSKGLKPLMLAFLVFSFTSSLADMPGNKTMADSKITFQDLGKWKGYEFHWWSDYGLSGRLYGDTMVTMPGSRGRPGNGFFWAINEASGKSTDSIFFDNNFAPDYIIILKGISGDSLKYKRVSLTNDNATGAEDEGGLRDVKNQELIDRAREKAYSKNTKYLLMIGLPVVALIILIVYFIKKRKRQSTGNV